jgi:hypothetical protein
MERHPERQLHTNSSTAMTVASAIRDVPLSTAARRHVIEEAIVVTQLTQTIVISLDVGRAFGLSASEPR